MAKHTITTIRELGYRSCIPYYILFDSELTIQHLRLYTLIEQMESNPNPKVTPTFSHQWFADLLGIEYRWARRIAQCLKEKGYITHKQKKDGRWAWGTVRKTIVDNTPQQPSEAHGVGVEGRACEAPPGGVCEAQGGGACEAPLNTNKLKYYKEETTNYYNPPPKDVRRSEDLPEAETSSSSFFTQLVDQSLLAQKSSQDSRTDAEFLAECVEHVDNHSNKQYPRLQRAHALVKLLTRLKIDNVIFRPKQNVELPKSKQSASMFTEEENELILEALHAKRVQKLGQDILLFITPERLAMAEKLLDRLKPKQTIEHQEVPNTPKHTQTAPRVTRENGIQSMRDIMRGLPQRLEASA